MRSEAPVLPSERIATLDILRGVALFIVLLINAVTEFRVSIFEQLLPSSATGSSANVIVLALHTKGIILFSLCSASASPSSSTAWPTTTGGSSCCCAGSRRC